MALSNYISGKICSLNQLMAVLNSEFRKKNKIVFTNGCFDLLHYGHLNILAESKDLGDILIVGLNNDNSVRRLKGKNRPVNSEENRAALLASLNFVDYVVLFEEDTPARLIDAIIPDTLVKGGDYIAEDIVGYHTVTSHGGKVQILPFIDGFSSTILIDQIKK